MWGLDLAWTWSSNWSLNWSLDLKFGSGGWTWSQDLEPGVWTWSLESRPSDWSPSWGVQSWSLDLYQNLESRPRVQTWGLASHLESGCGV